MLNTSEADVILAQETHAGVDKLPEVHADALDMGWKGQWLVPGGECVVKSTHITCPGDLSRT